MQGDRLVVVTPYPNTRVKPRQARSSASTHLPVVVISLADDKRRSTLLHTVKRRGADHAERVELFLLGGGLGRGVIIKGVAVKIFVFAFKFSFVVIVIRGGGWCGVVVVTLILILLLLLLFVSFQQRCTALFSHRHHFHQTGCLPICLIEPTAEIFIAAAR